MKTKSQLHPSPLFPISLLAFVPSLVFGAGLAAIKEQTFHQDAGANIVVYSSLKESGMSVTIETANRTFTIEPKKLVGKIEVLSALPANITTDTELEPVRKVAKEYRDFATRFPKSAPVLTPHIKALDVCIKDFEGGKARYNGEWIPKEEALAAKQKEEQARNEEEAALKKKREERIAFEKSQHAKGLVEYGGKWVPQKEAQRLAVQDEKLAKDRADAIALADQIAKNTFCLRGEITQITADGMIVKANMGSGGEPQYDKGKNRPEWFRDESVLIVGYPKMNQKADGDWFDVDAVYMGVQKLPTVLGAVRTFKKFQVIKSYY